MSLSIDMTIALCEDHSSIFMFDASFPEKHRPEHGCYNCDYRLFRFTSQQTERELAEELRRVARAVGSSDGSPDHLTIHAYEHAPASIRDKLEASYYTVCYYYRQYFPPREDDGLEM